MGSFRPWPGAWQDALYGPAGFYRRSAPADHFRTGAQLGGPLGRALAGLARRCGATRLVDLGCGRGELLAAVRRADAGLDLVGVDVVDRPGSLDPAVTWLRSPGGGALPALLDPLLDGALVVAQEWLDVVPATVVLLEGTLRNEAVPGGAGRWRTVEVDVRSGAERTGGPASAEEAEWLARWWPSTGPPGQRAEAGSTRDAAWADLVHRCAGRAAVLLAIDYAHRAEARPPNGTLIGYRAGRACPPVPDGSCDLTAHVALDAVAAAGRAAGAGAGVLTDQRSALRSLGVDGRLPDARTARADPAGYLARLAEAGTAARLIDPDGLGGFGWLAQPVGPDPTGRVAAALAELDPSNCRARTSRPGYRRGAPGRTSRDRGRFPS
jgi:Putative S-adenosyl-L-methionine-dependent methyltransferase